MVRAGSQPSDDIAAAESLYVPPMLAAVRSAAVLGIDAYDVTVEVDAAQGLPNWTIVCTKPPLQSSA